MDQAHLNYGANVNLSGPVTFKFASTGGGPGNSEIRVKTFDQWTKVNQKKT